METKWKKLSIWGVWFLILLVISVCYALQAVHDTRPLLVKLSQGFLVCGIPYVFFTLFYVIAWSIKQLIEIPFFLVIDIISVILVISNFGFFYEGSQAALNLLLIASSSIIIKIIILVFKK